MDAYLTRATARLQAFDSAVGALEAAILRHAGGFPQKQRDALHEVAERLRRAAGRLRHSMTQIALTGLDVVDLQARLEGEGAALAAALRSLGETVDRAPALRASLSAELFGLDEAAERVAAAIFPNAIEGVREVNRTLWQLGPIWAEYGRTLAAEVARTRDPRLTSAQLAAVERTAAQVRERFDAVNELLNQLVVSPPTDAAALKAVVRDARRALSDAVRHARSRAADAYKPFHGILKKAEKLAQTIDRQFDGVRVPVFPAAAALEDLGPSIDAGLYADLSGVERFALLNIAARMRSIPVGTGPGEHLLSPRFGIRIFDVFPDRVYLTADRGFIDAVEELASRGVFEHAPASLHRFSDGSFKQRQFRKGNLQISYALGSVERPGDGSKVRVDADIDLYRSALRHLFGEVLVNHLTGSKTDQFKVWDVLASGRVQPIGGFDVV